MKNGAISQRELTAILQKANVHVQTGSWDKLARIVTKLYPTVVDKKNRYLHVREYEIPFAVADKAVMFKVNFFLFRDGQEYTTLHIGDLSTPEPVLTRFNSECALGRLGGLQCDCEGQFKDAMKKIADAGRGIVIFAHDQTGQGIGPFGHHLAYANAAQSSSAPLHEQDLTQKAYLDIGIMPEHRKFEPGGVILKYHFGIKKVRFLTNSPDKVNALRKYGIEVQPEGITHRTKYNARMYSVKRERGHMPNNPDGMRPAHRGLVPQATDLNGRLFS